MKFACGKTQATSVIKAIQKLDPHAIPSLGTARDFKQCLSKVTDWTKENDINSLRDLTKEQAIRYLQERSSQIGQKTLDQERQAIQKMQQVLTHALKPDEKLPVVKSAFKQELTSRAYSADQVQLIMQHQSPRNAFATAIAFNAGLRAHELLCLERRENRAPDIRPASQHKFLGRDNVVIYTVKGKGGLVREVAIDKELSDKLEKHRRAVPGLVGIKDRDIFYKSSYDISGGNVWSASFTRASIAAVGSSRGAHGLRHAYAQSRLRSLQNYGLSYEDAKEVVSQEMGHFRSEITDTYLR